MQLPSEKSNQAALSPLIVSIFIFSLIYWTYLGLTTSMVIVFDAAGYRDLGQMIHSQGWITYFTSGPNREPVYPLLIALAMSLEHLTGLAYLKIMAFFGVVIMFLTQLLTYQILRLLNVRHGVCAVVLVYLGLSPSLNNTAFSLFSEIATYPFVLGTLLSSFYLWEAIKQNKKYKACFYSMLLGILLTSATLIKGIFECIAPVYLIILFISFFLTERKVLEKGIMPFILCIATAASFYYVPITSYKWFNLHYNGNFAITDRGSFMIYGSAARRVEPLTSKQLLEALAFTPGVGVCNSIFDPKECAFWAFQESDAIGTIQQNELIRQHLPPGKINSTLISLSVQKALQKPFQYCLLAVIEGLKMFFWESTKIGFVRYPHWLAKLYDFKILNNGLRFLVSLVSLIAVISLWSQTFSPSRSPLVFLIGTLIFLYILFFSFVCILDRYALPLAPLFLIAIGLWINQNFSPKKIK